MIKQIEAATVTLESLPITFVVDASKTSVEVSRDVDLPPDTAVLSVQPPENFITRVGNGIVRVASRPNTSGGEIVLRIGPGEGKVGDCNIRTTDANIDVAGTHKAPLQFAGRLTLESMPAVFMYADASMSEVYVGNVQAGGKIDVYSPRVFFGDLVEGANFSRADYVQPSGQQ